METYNYDYKYNSDIYKFCIKIYDELDRYDGEGILQFIQFEVDGLLLYETNFGREYALKYLCSDNNPTKNLFKDGIDTFLNDIDNKNITCYVKNYYDTIYIKDNDYDIFIEWLIESLTPLEKRRIKKINKINERRCK